MAQDGQKRYADQSKVSKEFKVGDHVDLQVKPQKGSLKLGNCTNLSPRFCGPFEVLKIIKPVLYKIALPINTKEHDVFHVSLLKKYIHDPNYVLDWNMIQVEPKGDF